MASVVINSFEPVAILALLILLGSFYEHLRREKIDLGYKKLGFKKFAKSKFKEKLGKHKFACFAMSVGQTSPSLHYFGAYKGFNVIIFCVTKERHTQTRFGLLIKDVFSELPNFIIKQKTITSEVRDMLNPAGINPAYPSSVTNEFDVVTEDSVTIAEIFTAEFTEFLLNTGGILVEVFDGDLMVYPTVPFSPKNCEDALEQAYRVAANLKKSIEAIESTESAVLSN
nr:hypothetical protein [uncultured Desulfuromonas sp.]